jgi:hypothetical protein
VTFFIALLLFCFSISNASTRIFVAIISAFMATLIGLSIWTTWESTEDGDGDVWQNSLVVFRRTRHALFEGVKKFIPFYTRRVLEDDRITLNSGLNEGRV